MKKDIHPKVHTNSQVICACGKEFITSSTSQSLKLDICSTCHPFYTGKQKFIDTEGRIDKFKKKMQKANNEGAPSKKKKKDGDATASGQQKTLKEMLQEAGK